MRAHQTATDFNRNHTTAAQRASLSRSPLLIAKASEPDAGRDGCIALAIGAALEDECPRRPAPAERPSRLRERNLTEIEKSGHYVGTREIERTLENAVST